MEKIIKDMIESAELNRDEDMADAVYQLLSQFAQTFNCPSNWRGLGEQMAQEYVGNNWVMENCKLWDFGKTVKENIKEYLDSINLNDYDLGGIEITEEDIEAIESKVVLKGRSIKHATNAVLYTIRESLD